MSFFTRLTFLLTLACIILLSCVSMNNHECKVRIEIVNVTNNQPVFFPFSIKISKCSGEIKINASENVKN